MELVETGQGLSLMEGDLALRCDLGTLADRLRPGRLERELLVRAARVRGVASPRALDATAGLGEDALLLAAAGFEVELWERNATIAALLRDGLARAARTPGLADAVARMTLHEGDSVAALRALAPGEVDVVSLDPMFPARTKSAAVKKKMQLLQRLERPCTDEDSEALLRAAVAAAPRKVVVKRPPKGPELAGVRPAYSLAGKPVRYDVIVPAQLPASER